MTAYAGATSVLILYAQMVDFQSSVAYFKDLHVVEEHLENSFFIYRKVCLLSAHA